MRTQAFRRIHSDTYIINIFSKSEKFCEYKSLCRTFLSLTRVFEKHNPVYHYLAIILSLFIFPQAVQANEDTFEISRQRFINLGVTLTIPVAINQVPLLYAPAKVVVPPDQEYIVSTSQSGLINKLFSAIGDTVTAGQILAQISSPQLLTLQSQLLKVNNERHLSRSEYQRDKTLFAEGVISNRRWLATKARYHSVVSEAKKARQLLEIAGMSVQEINELLHKRNLHSMLNVRAPINGVVLDRMTVAGTRIEKQEPLYRIANLQQLWLEIDIPQEKISRIKVGDQVLIEHTNSKAQISLLGQSVNAINQTILVRAVILEQHNSVRAGQTVNVQIIQPSNQPAYKVVNTALTQSEGQSYLFIRNQHGFTVKPVTIIGREGQFSIITGEIPRQAQIAVTGTVALKANWLEHDSGPHTGHGGH